jgi:beta-galactosidase
MEMFENADQYDMYWTVTENGKVIRSGDGVHNVGPVPFGRDGNKYGSANYTAEFAPIDPKANAEYFFNIEFRLREDAKPFTDVYYDGADVAWEEKGYVVAATQLELKAADLTNETKPLPPLSIKEINTTDNENIITIDGGDFEYVFNKEEGRFTSMTYQGEDIITSGPEPHFYRAPIDNDYGISNRATQRNYWRNAEKTGTGNNRLNRTRGETTINYTDNIVTIIAPFTTSANYGMNNSGSRTVYTIYPDGEVKVAQTYQFGSFGNNYQHLGEIGSAMTLSAGFDNISWFGRGPAENYIDRRWGSDVGFWQTTVQKNYT